MPRKILFIINPKAGKKLAGKVIPIIEENFHPKCEYHIRVWEHVNAFEQIAQEIKSGGYTDVIAAGGDGTVNRVAQELVNTSIRFGILPLGSGNGLARSLGLSMNLNRCLQQLADGKSVSIDTGSANGHHFFCTAGLGFDAHIGNLFASSIKRGLRSYVQIIARELFTYKAKEYTLHFNGTSIHKKAFLITVANAGQYGNDFYIAPQASMTDGKFHIVIVKPFNVLKVAGLLRNIMRRKAYLSRSIETFEANQISIEPRVNDSLHVDGEPMAAPASTVFTIHKSSLHVIVGDSFTS